MNKARVVRLVVVATGAFMFAGEAQAQTPAPTPGPRPADAELVFSREVFNYPGFTRRNPFRALAGTEGGPRFEQLTLIGIMFSPDPAASVAVLSTGGVTIAPDGTMSPVAGAAFYLKVGETLGNVRVVAIRRDAVDVDVEVFDAVERNTMNFVSRRQGGTR
jgi:hypothetical protein